MIVSGGTFCLPAVLLQEAKLRSAAMPFDWTFCSVQSLIWILQSEFTYFFDPTTLTSRTEVLGHPSATNGHYDSDRLDRPFFNHKDPTTEADRVYYQRCIERFLGLRGKKASLFVFDEFGEIDSLYRPLIETLDRHMPGLKLYGIRHHLADNQPFEIRHRVGEGGHNLYDLNASKVMDGNSFKRSEDAELLIQHLREHANREI